MSNPILVEVLRGTLVESRHTGAVAVVDAGGRPVLALGDVETPTYPRSAVKALQALPLVESGLTSKALAPRSWRWPAPAFRRARSCGDSNAHAFGRGARLFRAQMRRALANLPTVGAGVGAWRWYGERGPQQLLGQARGLSLRRCAIDGCSAPTWALPLVSLARGFARFGTGVGLTSDRANAAGAASRSLRGASLARCRHRRFCTQVMERFGTRIFVKTGAEGVYCAALPEQGFGIAVKCDDGAGRAAEVMVAATLLRIAQSITDFDGLEPFARVTLRNWNGIAVGAIRPTETLMS